MARPGDSLTARSDRSLDHFLAHGEARWRELEQLLDQVAQTSARGQSRDRLLRLMHLYRLASSDLNVARTLTSSPEILERLNQLVGRAYRIVYQAAPATMTWRSVVRFFTHDAPQTCRRQARWVALSAAACMLGTLLGFALVLARPVNGQVLIPQQFFTESPADRVDHIEHDKERIDNLTSAAQFGSYLYTHNIQVAFLCFALGASTLIGGLMLMFYNGLILGAIAALYVIDGVGTFFIAWVGPHGSLELPAIIIAGGAGMCLGRAVLVPGETGRSQAVHLILGDVVRLLFTACAVLVAAGLIEGSFSQFSSKSIPYPVKITLAMALLAGLMSWLFLTRGRSSTTAQGRGPDA